MELLPIALALAPVIIALAALALREKKLHCPHCGDEKQRTEFAFPRLWLGFDLLCKTCEPEQLRTKT